MRALVLPVAMPLHQSSTEQSKSGCAAAIGYGISYAAALRSNADSVPKPCHGF